MRSKWAVANRAARQKGIATPKVSGGAPCGTLPHCQQVKLLAERRRDEAGAHTAHPGRVHLLCARLVARAEPERERVPYSSCFFHWNAVAYACPPNPALQLTASRARS